MITDSHRIILRHYEILILMNLIFSRVLYYIFITLYIIYRIIFINI